MSSAAGTIMTKTGKTAVAQQQIISAAIEGIRNPTPTDRDRAFMARQLVQVTLPHRDPGKVEAWQRTNGNLTLVIRPGWDRWSPCRAWRWR
jgi:hypothetical protein